MFRSLFLAVWLTSPIWAQVPMLDPATLAEVTQTDVISRERGDIPSEVEVGSLIRVPLKQGERAFIFSTLGAVDVERSYTGLVFTGKPGLYIVHIFDLNDPDQIIPETHSVTIKGSGPTPVPPGPNPGPGPTPVPPGPNPPAPVVPEGFAGEVYKQAVAVGDKPNCLRIMSNYQTVRGMLAGNSRMTFEESTRALITLNQNLQLPKEKWSQFAVWIGQQANAKAQTRDELITFCDEVALGLEAAAK